MALPAVMSKSDFAALIGRGPSAVSNYIKKGTLTAEALEGDGRGARIRTHEALRQLKINLDPGQQMGQARSVFSVGAGAAAPPPSEASPSAARTQPMDSMIDIPRGAGADANERRNIARAEREELALFRERAEAQAANGEWLRAEDARAEYTGLIAQQVRTTEIWLQVEAPTQVLAILMPDDLAPIAEAVGTDVATVRQMIAALGVDQRAIGLLLRDGYRAERKRRAQMARDEAAERPLYAGDDGDDDDAPADAHDNIAGAAAGV